MATPHRTRSTASLTMRVDRATRQAADEIAQHLGTSMQEVVARAVESYRRMIIVEEANRAYARLRADTAASAAFDREHAVFEHALGDGMSDDPYPL